MVETEGWRAAAAGVTDILWLPDGGLLEAGWGRDISSASPSGGMSSGAGRTSGEHSGEVIGFAAGFEFA